MTAVSFSEVMTAITDWVSHTPVNTVWGVVNAIENGCKKLFEECLAVKTATTETKSAYAD